MSWLEDEQVQVRRQRKQMRVTDEVRQTQAIERDISLEERQELQNLNAEMNELAEMMQDMKVLVDEQQEKIDLIEDNVEASVTHVEKGRKHIKKATNMQKAGSKGVMNWFMRKVFGQ